MRQFAPSKYALADLAKAARRVRHVFGGSQNLPRRVRHVFGGSQNHPRGVRHVFGGSQKQRAECGTFSGGHKSSARSAASICGSFRKLTQVCGTFAEVSASFSQVCGAFAEVSASSLKRAGRLRNFPQAHSSVRTFAEVSASTPQYFLRPSRLPQKSKREIRSLYRRTSRFSQWRRRATSGPHLSYPLIYQWFRSPSARRRVVRPYHRSGNAV